MSKKEDEDFATWQADLGKEFEADPETAAAWATLSGKASEKVRDKFYRGTLRQDEFHRRLNETAAEKKAAESARLQAEQIVQQNWDWYKMSAPEYEKAVKRAEVLSSLVQSAGILGGEPGAGQVTPPVESRQMSSELEAKIQQLEQQNAAISRGLPNFIRDFATVSHVINKEGYSIDPTSVIDYSSTRGVTLQQALADLTVDERAQRQQDDIKRQVAAGVEEEKRKLMASYPTPDAMRGGPRASLHDQMKQMEALASPDSRREAGVALLRDALVKSSA